MQDVTDKMRRRTKAQRALAKDTAHKCEDGAFRISDRPGHGIALTAAAEKKYRMA